MSRARKVRRPALRARAHALTKVVRVAQSRLLGELALRRSAAALDQADAHRRARCRESERRALCYLTRERERGSADLILRHEHIGETHLLRLLALQPAARIEHETRLVVTDELRERHRQAEARMKAEP